MATAQGPGQFPLKTAGAIASVAAALLAWHTWVKMPPGLDWRSLPAVATLPEFTRAPEVEKKAAQAPEPNVRGSGQPSQISLQPADALLIDNAGSLDRFYAGLAGLEKHAPAAGVTVMHFGDSPTTADLITGDVRQQLQETLWRRRAGLQPGGEAVGLVWASRYRRERPRLEVCDGRGLYARRAVRHWRCKL